MSHQPIKRWLVKDEEDNQHIVEYCKDWEKDNTTGPEEFAGFYGHDNIPWKVTFLIKMNMNEQDDLVIHRVHGCTIIPLN